MAANPMAEPWNGSLLAHNEYPGRDHDARGALLQRQGFAQKHVANQRGEQHAGFSKRRYGPHRRDLHCMDHQAIGDQLNNASH
jgi:hypothetical protein